MRKNVGIIASILLTVIFMSCVSQKNLTYLNYLSEIDKSIINKVDDRITVTPILYRINPYDIVYINVVTPDPQWSVLFNAVSASEGGTLTEESATLLGYPVDEKGNIELPFVGLLHVGGKTLAEVKTDVDSTLKNYVTDASITVKLVNNFVSIIGEVNSPGRYPLTKYRINIFEALSMAGDLSFYSNRQKVQLIRPSENGPILYEFSLKDRSILLSELYYIMPNDILYVRPLKSRSFQINSSTYSLVLSSVATILTSITTLFVIFGYNR